MRIFNINEIITLFTFVKLNKFAFVILFIYFCNQIRFV
jgi:hypothetical protein